MDPTNDMTTTLIQQGSWDDGFGGGSHGEWPGEWWMLIPLLYLAAVVWGNITKARID